MDAPTPTWELIAGQAALTAFLDRHRDDQRCAIDLEADSLHRYGERICLIQIESAGEIALVDPLGEDLDPKPLHDWLSGRAVWMHGADYDMRLLRAAGAPLPDPLHDTQIAAQLVGRQRFGLAALIEEEFGVKLSKASQKADWARRPLPEKMLVYAALDVYFLQELADRLVDELHQKGRHDWFLEAGDWARRQGLERAERDPDEIWRVNGWGRLSRRGLGYLRALWHWRDQSAEAWDRPVFYLANNQMLLDWASALENGEKADFSRVRSRWRKPLDRAVSEAQALPAEQLPVKRPGPRGPKRSADWDKQVEALRQFRNKRAKQLGLDPGVLVARATLEALVTDPGRADDLLMSWQRECLGIGEGWRP